MKTRIIITGALIILFVVILYIVMDLFFIKPGQETNPFEYGMEDLKRSDSALTVYREVREFKPGLSDIYGIAIDQKDRIFISGKEGVEVFDTAGINLFRFSTEEDARALTTDQKGRIYLGMEDHVEIRDSMGNLLKTWKTAGEGSIITSIAVTGTFVFVADAGRKVVYRYDLSGRILNRIGEKDPQNNIPGFVIPSPYFDLAVDRDGFLWVANTGRHNLEKYTFDGKLLSKWGTASNTTDGFCGCCNPSHFAFLHDGSFVTSEKGIERVKVYSHQGVFKDMVSTPDSFDEGTKGLDLAVDSRDRILVLDPAKKMVRIFEKIKSSAENIKP